MHFTPAKQRSFMGVLRSASKEAMNGAAPVDEPIELQVVASYLAPKRTKAKQAHPASGFKPTRSDLSNSIKIIEDSLNGIVWTDDARIAVIHAAKVYGDHPGLTISVRPLSFMDWPFLGGVTA